MMIKIFKFHFLLIALIISVNAQDKSGNIEGLAADSQGAVIPFAKIEAVFIDDEKETKRSTTTNESGKFKFSNLPFGTYELRLNFYNSVIKKRVELKPEKPFQKDVTVTASLVIEGCSETNSESISDFVTEKDKAEIVRQMLKLLLEKQSNLLTDEQKQSKLILSIENIKKEWLTVDEKQKFVLMNQSEIQRIADEKEDFLYLRFSELKVKDKCIAVSLDNIWAVGKDSKKAYLSGGGFTYEFRKIDNRWIGKYVIGWIS